MEDNYRKLLLLTSSVVAILWLACVNSSVIFVFDQFPDVNTIYGKGWKIALCYLLTTGFALLVLSVQQKGMENFLQVCMGSKWIMAFLALALLSILWSVNKSITLYEVTLLTCATVMSIFIYLQFSLRLFINVLVGFAACCTVISWLLVLLLPETSIMWGKFHFASWMGLFWHRNHTGSMMAFFNMIFLFKLLFHSGVASTNNNDRITWFYVAFYILTAIHVFGSQSATGKVVFLALNSLVACCYLWKKDLFFNKPLHYILCSIILLFVVAGFLTNPDFFFSLLNRSSAMTGRTNMWPDLINNTVLERPILGHGFATAWAESDFRTMIMQRWGWSYQPYFADNGLIDLMIGLGAVGTIIFLYGLIYTTAKIIKQIFTKRHDESIFLMAVMAYIVTANLTYSFLFEIEYLTWSLLLLLYLYATSKPRVGGNIQLS